MASLARSLLMNRCLDERPRVHSRAAHYFIKAIKVLVSWMGIASALSVSK